MLLVYLGIKSRKRGLGVGQQTGGGSRLRVGFLSCFPGATGAPSSWELLEML